MAILNSLGLSVWRRSWVTVSVALVVVVAACDAGLGGSDSASKPETSSQVVSVMSDDPVNRPKAGKGTTTVSAQAQDERVTAPERSDHAVIDSFGRAEGIGRNTVSGGIRASDSCDVYGWREVLDRRAYRWHDRIPIWGDVGGEIVFADGDAVYSVSADATQLWRPVREAEAQYVGGRSRYVLAGLTSVDISGVDGALVYATCRAYAPDGSDPEIARCVAWTDTPSESAWRECSKNPPHTRVNLSYPSGEVDFRIGGDLYEISVMRPAEGTVTRLYVGNFPAWSPDGQRIAFVSVYGQPRNGASGGGRVHTVAHDGLTTDFMARLIGISRSRLHTIAADGTDLRSIDLPPGVYANYPPRWSPDGTRLAFVAIEDDTVRFEIPGDATYAIYTVRADGTGLKRLSDARSNPAWSPDGTRLAFVKPNRGLHLYTIAADGTDGREITAVSAGTTRFALAWVPAVAWSPGGSQILYRCGSRVCVVGLDGRPVGAYSYPNEGSLIPAWSSDGTRLALYNVEDTYGTRGEVVLRSTAPDGSDGRVLVRERQGLVADQAENFTFPGPVATRASCTAGVVVPMPPQNPGLVRDCETLVASREVLFGRAATNWTANVPLQEWEGVTVSGSPARVTRINLRRGAIGTFDHGGRLPPALAELEYLRQLDLSDNRLAGSIPAAWGAMPRLLGINLSRNDLTGAIPPELGSLPKLQYVALSENRLSGPIPPALSQPVWLQSLLLDNNQLTGAIPVEFGQAVRLQYLSLGSNQLTGPIPPELSRLAKLGSLSLASNHLTDSIPPELGQLANLQHLDLSSNHLTGPIPPSLGQLTQLQRLFLSDNQLTGEIPATFGSMESLQDLSLSGNQLTGCIPRGLMRLERMRTDLPSLELPLCRPAR